MGIEFLTSYMIPVIVGICLAAGYIVKHWIKDVDNKIIPTLCAALGVLLAFWINWGNITPETILSGLVSGLASTGLHQAFRQLVDGKANG
jgi:ABC-type thiamin/hydroxymethylpyrimidine transport system permease subunit